MGKCWKYIHSTRIIEFQHNLLQTAHLKAGNNIKTTDKCKWDPIKLIFMYYMHQHF